MRRKSGLILLLLLAFISLPMPILAAWNICVKDGLYITQYQLNLESGNVLRGQAIASSPEFPAPLTGYYNTTRNTASFSIGYLNDNSRHYWIEVGTMTGYSWGILGTDSSFYDNPRAATLVPCSPDTMTQGDGNTGAHE